MKCLILAAGRGSRLAPLTDTIPKCLVPLCGRPLLEWQLSALKTAGISDIHIVTGYLRDQIEAYRINCWHNPNWNSSNMLESMMCARELFLNTTDDILVLYSDLVYEPRIVLKLVQTRGDIVVAVDKGWEKLWTARMSDPLSDAESLRYDSNGILLEIGQRAEDVADVQAQYMGMIKFNHSGLKMLLDFWDKTELFPSWAHGRSKKQAFMTDLLNAMIGENYSIRTCAVEHGWLEVDSLSDLETYEAAFAEKCVQESNKYLPDLSWSLKN